MAKKEKSSQTPAPMDEGLVIHLSTQHLWTIGAIIAILIIFAFVLTNGFGTLGASDDSTSEQGIQAGDSAKVSYTGKFLNGTVFDSGEFEFEIGADQVVPGFESAVLEMETGETKTVTLDPAEAYGEADPEMIQEIDKVTTSTRVFLAELELVEANTLDIVEEGATINLQGLSWPVYVVEVNETTVALRGDPEVGETYDSEGLAWPIKVESMNETDIVLNHLAEIGDTISSWGYEGVVTAVTEDTITVDYNSPLAGKSLVFTITLEEVITQEKSEVAEVKAFIMSYCPYGRQAASGLAPVANLLGDSANIEPVYIVYPTKCRGTGEEFECYSEQAVAWFPKESGDCAPNQNTEEETNYLCAMHGETELTENKRQLCIYHEQSDNYWNYMACMSEGAPSSPVPEWTTCAEPANVDTASVETCVDSQQVLVWITDNYELSQEYDTWGSPAVFINGNSHSGGRAAEDYKQAICSVLEPLPSGCSQTLSGETVTGTGSC